MKVIVAGSRSITEYNTVAEAIDEADFEPTEIVSGGAEGVDKLGEQWAHSNSIPLRTFDVTQEMYEEYGNYAFKKRNKEMSEYADALIAIWDGESSGTKHMIEVAESNGLETYIKNTGVTLSDF